MTQSLTQRALVLVSVSLMALAPSFALAQTTGLFIQPISQLAITTQTSGTPAPSSASTVTVTGAGVTLGSIPSSVSSVSYSTFFTNDTRVVSMIPGNYSVSAAPISGYAYTYSSGCAGAFPAQGGDASCTITASPTTGSSLIVYTNVVNSTGGFLYPGYGAYSPSNFSISVTGSSPSPSNFQGSSSGTVVSLAPGVYQVTPSTLAGWTMSQTGNCSGSIAAGQTLACTVTYTYIGSGAYYPNIVVPPSTSLACVPQYSSLPQGGTGLFIAQGGSGGYNWSTSDGRSFLNAGQFLNVAFHGIGQQTVTVSSGGQTATCLVNVGAFGFVTNPNYQTFQPVTVASQPFGNAGYVSGGLGNASYTTPSFTPVLTQTSMKGVALPSLPNTGAEPQDGSSMAFAAVFIIVAVVLVLPYVRKTLRAVRG